jgi:predicted MFS family arabinose efflux permease
MTTQVLAFEGSLARRQGHPTIVRWGLVFAPFVAGYFLSYLYRTITALISDGLARDLDLGPADLGLLASMYFLAFGLIQLPLGVWLDRFGPRRVQAVLLAIAAAGALMFALAGSFATLMLARILIGLGVAGGLMAGLKAIVLWFPPDRIALANGWFVMVGALGAVTATQPAELLLAPLGWRGLFILLAGLTALSALLVLALVPERDGAAGNGATAVSIAAIYRDRRFWRLAPLSATVIGSAWALQGLWAAPWLRDVEGLSRAATVNALLLMACALAAGAFVLGSTAHRLRRAGIGQPALLAFASALSVLAQFALVMRWPVPPLVPWLVIAALGAATVLSYAILADTFPKAVSGRANGALNLLHVVMAFAVQAGIGRIVELWPLADGRPPLAAYQAAFSVNLALQAIALVWFVVTAWPARTTVYTVQSAALAASAGLRRPAPIPYEAALAVWIERVEAARVQRLWWRRAAIASLCLLATIGAIAAQRVTAISVIHVVQIAEAR